MKMSLKIRRDLYNKIKGLAFSENVNNFVTHLDLKLDDLNGDFCYSLPLKTEEYDISNVAKNIADLNRDDLVNDITITKEQHSHSILFKLNRNLCIKNIIENNPCSVTITDKLDYKPKKIIVEYSSPNIAKPFHVGHLRSTILGNYIANINDFLSNDVKRINYLGDWGTQFGFVQLGINLLQISDERMKKNPIAELYNAYIYANKIAETDPSISDKARKIFSDLEAGDSSNDLQKWESFRKFTVDELRTTYKRLGVSFDEYNWESEYNAKKISKVIGLMESRGILVTDKENRRVIPLSDTRNIPIIKSDGSTLYITRDIAAALDRFDRHKFDCMYYVVDNAQTDHFNVLNKVLEKMEFSWSSKIRHVKFGRIKKMSTRKGSVVFLSDILDETRTIMRENQIKSPNTKVSLDSDDESTDVLGISAVIINDLKQRRLRDYEFDWNKALDIKGDTGVKLQYLHCRLTSLEENCGTKLPLECDPLVLTEPIIGKLVIEIGRFDQAVFKSHQELEPCILVNYLFRLSNTVNKGLKVLRIKGEPNDIGSQRLLVFHAAKNVLAQGMKLLGLQPLKKM